MSQQCQGNPATDNYKYSVKKSTSLLLIDIQYQLVEGPKNGLQLVTCHNCQLGTSLRSKLDTCLGTCLGSKPGTCTGTLLGLQLGICFGT